MEDDDSSLEPTKTEIMDSSSLLEPTVTSSLLEPTVTVTDATSAAMDDEISSAEVAKPPLTAEELVDSSSLLEPAVTSSLLEPTITVTDATSVAMDDDISSAEVAKPPLTAEELVAKAIAPVKKEFLRPPPVNRLAASDNYHTNNNDDRKEKGGIVKEKKSKRQLKRERREERESALNLCPAVAKTEDASACKYGDRCRFSHNVEAYKAQRPVDLEGECPFMSAQKPCPYGLSCRYNGTHKDVTNENMDASKDCCSEVNMLKKDVQKLLWKNKMNFPKSNVALKQLGVEGKGHTRVKDLDVEENNLPKDVNGSHCSEDNGCDKNDSADKLDASTVLPEEPSKDGTVVTDDSRPLKKAKSDDEIKDSSNDVDNGCDCTSLSASGEACARDSTEDKPQSTDDYLPPETDDCLKLHPRERKLIDFRGKLYLAPLTTVGNLPFRRVCKGLGADVTCGEMAMCTNLLQGHSAEWALLRRHKSEDLFGVQICGAYPDTVARAVELIDQECSVDFIDINMGCPIDIVVNKGAGSALLTKPLRMKNVIHAACASAEKPITVKVRTGYIEGRNRADSLISSIYEWGASAVTVHGRSRQQRYSKLADWEYINTCVKRAPDSFQVLGNGDVFSYLDWNKHFSDCPELSSCMIARGALIKPWLFTEIKEQRHWDISSGERLDILKDYVRFGLEHWGSDTKGVETTRHFLLEWLSYTFRYVPVGLLDVIPQRINWRPPSYYGRDDLETLMASESAADWIRISELLLGKVPPGFTFAPKHKSNAYDSAENG